MNIKLEFSYDGSRFNGSQKQPEKNTVADAFLECFNSMGIDSQLVFSGRTDKNVHATRQVANIKLPSYWTDTQKLFNRLKQYLPQSIQLHSLNICDDDFNARFSAKKRVYRYIISQKYLTSFEAAYMTYYEPIIDEKLIKNGIKQFIGTHDFEYFSKKGSEPVSTTRIIYDTKFYKYKDFYIFKFKANSFLRSQIRMMVQALFDLNEQKITLIDLNDQINKKGLKSKTLAPPNGLYLTKIIY
jgi:tRNA pseudouridine38-40 synthase